MGLKKPIDLDAPRQDELGLHIRELAERIAHLKTYTDNDTGLLELQLQELIEQHKQEINHGR